MKFVGFNQILYIKHTVIEFLIPRNAQMAEFVQNMEEQVLAAFD